jgi:putative ABC transport system permease protein
MPSAIKLTSLVESARVGADSLRSNPLRTVLATTGVIIGVAALVAAFAITDGVEVWSRALIARESSVQDVAVTARTQVRVRGRSVPVRGYPQLTLEDAERAQAEVPGVMGHALMLNGRAETEHLGARATVQLTLGSASLAEFAGLRLAGGRFFTAGEEMHGAPVIVLGHRTATELAGVHDPLWLVGRTIRAGAERREVVGVLEAPAGGDEPDLVAFAPLRGGDALLEPSAAPRVRNVTAAEWRSWTWWWARSGCTTRVRRCCCRSFFSGCSRR